MMLLDEPGVKHMVSDLTVAVFLRSRNYEHWQFLPRDLTRIHFDAPFFWWTMHTRGFRRSRHSASHF